MKNLRWVLVGLIFLATTINYIDRQTISVAAPVISKEFGFNAQDYSWIVFSFLLAYAVMQVVSGLVIDRVGTRRGFTISVVGWSIANMLHAFGAGVLSFSVFRALLGTFEAGNYPAALKAIAEWFPKSERSTAVGIVNMGPGLGAILAPPLVAWLILSVGWRGSFVVTGAIGFLWLVAWRQLYHPPGEHPLLTPGEATLIREGRGEDGAAPSIPWHRLLRDREMWGLMLARFSSDGAFYFFVFWLPKYLADERGFSIAQIGLWAWIPFLAADLGSIVGGWSGTRLIRGGFSIDASRKLMVWVGALFVLVSLFTANASTPHVALLYVAIAMFGIQVKSSSLFAVPADLYPARSVALAWGLSGAAGSLGGMAFTPVVGYLVDHVSYRPVFWIVSFMHLVSALFLTALVPRIERKTP